ncbi:MAG TPA: hypothetical protein VLL54_11570 [Pyrinomonadaceae bacterium]|nr:hypothetical protein [Pyrinomonadaceae bacterium]
MPYALGTIEGLLGLNQTGTGQVTLGLQLLPGVAELKSSQNSVVTSPFRLATAPINPTEVIVC